ncbi:MAG: PIG-L family deacetylase [Patescibacteria group bacterium]
MKFLLIDKKNVSWFISLIFVVEIFFLYSSSSAVASSACPLGTSLSVVAHQDDDLLFINPDIQHDISAGKCVVTIFLTAGDANQGSAYWLSRESGSKAAYAKMSTVPNQWEQTNGSTFATFTLTQNPLISLVFMRLPDGNTNGGGFSNNNFESLQKLWLGNISVIHAVDDTASFTKQDIINTLANLLQKYQPSQIRIQNYQDTYNSSVDHSDHYSAAYLVFEAHTLYTSPHILTGYYDYQISLLPSNVTGTDLINKEDAFLAYAQYDPLVCNSPAACANTSYGSWLSRQYKIEPTPTPTPVAGGAELLTSSSWTLAGNNGSAEKNLGIPANSLSGMASASITFNLHGSTFGKGDDEASIVFVQNNDWYGANVVLYGQNGKDGLQIISIPLADFHKIGNASIKLDTTKSVSDLHARFWRASSFSVDVTSVQLTGTGTTTPDPIPVPIPTPTPVAGGAELLTSSSWTLAGNNGSAEKNLGIPANSLSGMASASITFNLHGSTFGKGDDEASIVFVQNNDWYGANVVLYGQNGKDGLQIISIPLADFHKIGNASIKLDTTKSVSDLHARFWRANAFTVDITSVTLN